jgi:ABC-type amino acid transport substrate-binding protein
MLDIFTKILEQFGAFFRLQEQLSSLSNNNPVIAAAVIFVLTVIVANVVITQIIEIRKKFLDDWIRSRFGWAGLLVGFSLTALVSTAIVLNLRQASSAAPVFDNDRYIVVGSSLLLQWDFPNKNARFEIQSAKDPAFKVGVEKNTVDGAYFPAENINGERFWRVREIDPDNRTISRWSRSVQSIQYDTTLQRIQATRNVIVYISNSFNEGFFKFDVTKDGERTTKGYDIAVIEEVIKRLPALLEIDGPLKFNLKPVKWEELLDTPKSGRADVIISTITSFPKREEEFGIKFSHPYYCTTQSLIYRPPPSSRPVLEMISGRKVGVQRHTTSQDIMRQFKSEAPEERKFELREEYDQAGTMIDALTKHLIDVGLTDTPFGASCAVEERYRQAGAQGVDQGRRFPEDDGAGAAFREICDCRQGWREQTHQRHQQCDRRYAGKAARRASGNGSWRILCDQGRRASQSSDV